MKTFFLSLVLGFSFFAHAEEKKEIPKESKKQVLDILELNEKLHAQFFDYESKKVQETSQAMAQKIEGIEDAKIKKLLGFAQKTLEEMGEDLTREENNERYHRVSMALLYLINTYDLGAKYQGYRCPMVKKKWVQNTEKTDKVLNPYAPKMKHCGNKLSQGE